MFKHTVQIFWSWGNWVWLIVEFYLLIVLVIAVIN